MPQFNYIHVENGTPDLRTIYNFIIKSTNTYAIQYNCLYKCSLDGEKNSFGVGL